MRTESPRLPLPLPAAGEAAPSRRRTLAAIGAAWFAAAVSRLALPPRASPERSVAITEFLRTTFPDRDAVAATGAAYLALHPSEAGIAHLEESLFRGLSAVSPGVLARHVVAGAAADFKNGDVVLVEGWTLARTEARLCGLASLLIAHDS